MNFESEKKSPAELRRQAEMQMRLAQDTQTFVSLTEKNWAALLNIEQNFLTQLQVQEKRFDSLLTRPDIERYLQTQENLMQEHLERLEQTSAAFARKAGSMSEKYSSVWEKSLKEVQSVTETARQEITRNAQEVKCSMSALLLRATIFAAALTGLSVLVQVLLR